jgi:putative nucleotidyltransferase with HDIG domain
VSIFDSFTRGVKAEAEVISGLWMHSFSVAVVCQELWRRRTNKKEGEIAFLCGLLHDLGKVIFFKLDPKAYAGFFRHEEGAERARLCDFEVETFGLDHAEAGAKLAKVWGLPPELALAIGRHHKADETDPPLVVAVALADQLVRSIKIGLEGDSVDQEELERLLTCLKCTEEECARLLESAERQKNYMEGFFILPVEPYRRPA